jgi:methylthioribose-1-phosphate isomerase
MRAGGAAHRTAWLAEDGWSLQIIDQRLLPHRFEVARLSTLDEVVRAIAEMQLRGAPLIGVAAAYGVCLALRADPSDASLEKACAKLGATRPTAVNLAAALAEMRRAAGAAPISARVDVAYAHAARMADDEAAAGKAIGERGLRLIEEAAARKGGKGSVNVLTHCNAGWLATLDWGTALAPIYLAHRRGMSVHVWVDETRPRNQGATLTAWELLQEGVPHTVIADNAGGHLMQHGQVDLCLVGSDRTTRRGDVCNKIGTYLKALAARDTGVPFYAAVPFSSIDWSLGNGVEEIPIEERDPREVTHVSGRLPDGTLATVRIPPEGSTALNPGFDVTPARLVTGILTEHGVCPATEAGLRKLWPEAPGSGSGA